MRQRHWLLGSPPVDHVAGSLIFSFNLQGTADAMGSEGAEYTGLAFFSDFEVFPILVFCMGFENLFLVFDGSWAWCLSCISVDEDLVERAAILAARGNCMI